jgi:hypothetical protein
MRLRGCEFYDRVYEISRGAFEVSLIFLSVRHFAKTQQQEQLLGENCTHLKFVVILRVM